MSAARHPLAAAVVPLLPDGDEAREWAERELADPVYQAAEPTFFDRLVRTVLEFIESLFSAPVSGQWGPLAFIVLAVLVIAAIVIGILLWGRPRAIARARPAARALFDDDDHRTAEALRTEAAAAAARADWGEAVVLRFRAFARDLGERGLVDPPPGATARAFARTAAEALPVLGTAPAEGAVAFDDVRYLGRAGTEAAYRLVTELDEAGVRARPVPAETSAARS